MKVEHYRDLDPLPVEGIEEATEGLTIRRVISEVDGATEFTMESSKSSRAATLPSIRGNTRSSS